jgi:hypothetical protein
MAALAVQAGLPFFVYTETWDEPLPLCILLRPVSDS